MNREFIIAPRGGVGDALVATPTLRRLKETHADHKIVLYCSTSGQLDVFRHNPHVDSLRFLNGLQMLRYPRHLYAYLFDRKSINYTELYFQYISLNVYEKTTMEITAEIFDLTLKDKTIEIYLTEAEERKARETLAPYQHVVFMHIHSRSSPNHHWKLENWAKLVKQLPQYTFIQLGSPDEPSVAGALDWRGKTSLREAFALLKFATSFVGVESSLAHVTNAFNVPGVVLFGDSSPVYWGHENNVNIYKNVPCSPCYYFLWKNPCPYDHECMGLITVEEVKRALVAQINSRKKALVPEHIG